MKRKVFTFMISLVCLGTTSLTLGTFYLMNKANGHLLRMAKADSSYTFLFDKDNAPTLTGADEEQKEVVATGLGNRLYLTYSNATNAAYAHAILSLNGYIANHQPINDMQSLVIVGAGSFKLGYGIEAITNYVNINLDDSSYTLNSVEMNYFKLVALSNNATVVSISGTDVCSSAAEYGVREFSTASARKTEKMTRLIHDVPATQAFTYNISWTQAETESGNNLNPKIILLDADALYKADDSFAAVSDSDTAFGCKGVQFGQERTVMNYKNGSTAGNNVSSDTAAGASKAGVANAFVDTSGTIFTTGLIDDNSGKPIGTGSGQAGLGWSVLRVNPVVNVTITYTPDVDGLHEFTVVWNISKTIESVDWSFTMTQRARFNNISNIAVAAGAAKCNWEVYSVSSTGLH